MLVVFSKILHIFPITLDTQPFTAKKLRTYWRGMLVFVPGPKCCNSEAEFQTPNEAFLAFGKNEKFW